MNLTLIQDAQAADEPLTLEEAKDYLRLPQEPGEDDNTVTRLIAAVREIAETQSGRHQARKQFTLALDAFPTSQGLFTWPYATQYTDPILYQFKVSPSYIELLDPLVSVDSFAYKKSDETPITMIAGTDYVADTLKHPGIVCPPYNKTWPGEAVFPSSAVQITFTCGYLPSEVPTAVKQGMLLLISQLFEKRIPFETIRFVAEVPFNVTALLSAKKLWKF